MPALSKFLVLLGIFLSASHANAFPSRMDFCRLCWLTPSTVGSCRLSTSSLTGGWMLHVSCRGMLWPKRWVTSSTRRPQLEARTSSLLRHSNPWSREPLLYRTACSAAKDCLTFSSLSSRLHAAAYLHLQNGCVAGYPPRNYSVFLTFLPRLYSTFLQTVAIAAYSCKVFLRLWLLQCFGPCGGVVGGDCWQLRQIPGRGMSTEARLRATCTWN